MHFFYCNQLHLFCLGIMLKDIFSYTVLVLTIISAIVNVIPILSLVLSWKRLLISDVLLLNIFVTNLLLGIGYVVPLHSYFSGYASPSHLKCIFTGYFVFFIACTNILTMEALSFHRYILVKKPIYGGKFKKRKDIGAVVVLIAWIYGAIVASPPLFGISEYVVIIQLFTCELDFNSPTPENKAYLSFAAIQGYIVPAIVMIFCGYHCIISKHIRRPSLTSNRFDLKNPKEVRFTRSIHAMLLSFLISWFPYVAVCFCNFINVHVNEILYAICTLFAKASSIVVTTVYMISYRGSRSLSFHAPGRVKTKHNGEKFRTLVITSSDAEEKHGHSSVQINTL